MAVVSGLRYVLFPGRHHLLTRFQATYLKALVAGGLTDTNGAPLAFAERPMVVFAVTSANHRGTRRNPIPYDRREAAIERSRPGSSRGCAAEGSRSIRAMEGFWQAGAPRAAR